MSNHYKAEYHLFTFRNVPGCSCEHYAKQQQSCIFSALTAAGPDIFQFVVSFVEGRAHSMAFPSKHRTPGAFYLAVDSSDNLWVERKPPCSTQSHRCCQSSGKALHCVFLRHTMTSNRPFILQLFLTPELQSNLTSVSDQTFNEQCYPKDQSNLCRNWQHLEVGNTISVTVQSGKVSVFMAQDLGFPRL